MKESSRDITNDLEMLAEDANEHTLASMYIKLNQILLDEVGEKKAASIMKTIRDDYSGFIS